MEFGNVKVEDALFSYVEWTVTPLLHALSGGSVQNLEYNKRLASEEAETEHVASMEELLAICALPKVFIDRLQIRKLSFNVTARVSLPILNSFDGTPLNFAVTSMRQVFAFPDQLLKDLAANYVADTIVRSPLLLMSLNIIGNPA